MMMRVFRLLCWLLLISPLFYTQMVHANLIKGVRVWPSPDTTQVVFDLAEKPKFELKVRNSTNLSIVLDEIDVTTLGAITGEMVLVQSIKIKRLSGKQAEVMLALTAAANPKLFHLAPSERYGHRLVLALTPRADATRVSKATPEIRQPVNGHRQARDIIIAIDAGHGGHDPGAVGPKGTYEKHVTMAISQKLKALIDKEPGFKAVMTRTSDYYIYPSKRPELARDRKADLLVSIHADAAENRKAQGASVWILSLKRATTEVGRMLERTEEHSELLGGVAEVIKDSDSERYFNQTVLDLQMQHSMGTGLDVAKVVLAELGRVTKLHKKEPQSASLGVLKAPDIPSILVETGYISNVAEEQKLKNPAHQQKIANAVFRALRAYYLKNPPADSRIAQGSGRSTTTNSRETVVAQRPESVDSMAAAQDDLIAEAITTQTPQTTNSKTNVVKTTSRGLPSGSPSAKDLPTVKADSIAGTSATKTSSKTPSKTTSTTTPSKTVTGPKKAQSAPKMLIYKVKPGDALSRLAKKHGVSMAELRRINNLKSDNIQIGQKLKIPQS